MRAPRGPHLYPQGTGARVYIHVRVGTGVPTQGVPRAVPLYSGIYSTAFHCYQLTSLLDPCSADADAAVMMMLILP